MSGRKFTLSLLLLDTFTLVALFNVLAWIRGVIPYGTLIAWPLIVPWVLVVSALYLIDGYKARTDMISVDYTSLHSIALGSALLTTLLITFAFFPDGYRLQGSRAVIAIGMLSLLTISLGYRRFMYQRRTESERDRIIVFLGDRASAEHFRTECGRHALPHTVVYSIIDDSSSAPFHFPQSQTMRPCEEVIASISSGELSVEAIVLKESGRSLNAGLAQSLVQLYFQGVPTYTLELFNQVYWRKIPLYRLNQTWLFQEGFQIAREPVFDRIKRVADIGLASLGLILSAPIIALAAMAIRLEDGGPVLFRQNRVGKNRALFQVIKLRTMRAARATSSGDERYTQLADPRITAVGRFLRSSRIDEFPQLWNVLVGEMSLIGPRAEWDRLVEDYEKQIPCYHFRHLVRPGITGWAQVNYPYGANLEDTQHKLEYDLYYIRHFSFFLDASIVLKTIHTMIFGRGR
ncbi:MAG TPA: exopolysaccharide biosynthesis polyprenyl glycosylphosphotransferase [Opitutaceae bacterium]